VSNAPGKPVSFSRPKVGYFSNRPRIAGLVACRLKMRWVYDVVCMVRSTYPLITTFGWDETCYLWWDVNLSCLIVLELVINVCMLAVRMRVSLRSGNIQFESLPPCLMYSILWVWDCDIYHKLSPQLIHHYRSQPSQTCSTLNTATHT